MMRPIVISLGGSTLVPKQLDARFLRRFVAEVRSIARSRRVFIVPGGGSVARDFVAAARSAGIRDTLLLHWIGVRACQLNAAVLQAAFGLPWKAVMDRSNIRRARGRIVVVAPSVPGTTSDYGSILAAKAVGADVVYNLTNVDGVYTADPRKYRTARFISDMTWNGFRKMFSRRITPGMHVPFDPAASALAARSGLTVHILSSRTSELSRAVAGRTFRGTTIRPA